jgi:hypothetical protein
VNAITCHSARLLSVSVAVRPFVHINIMSVEVFVSVWQSVLCIVRMRVTAFVSLVTTVFWSVAVIFYQRVVPTLRYLFTSVFVFISLSVVFLVCTVVTLSIIRVDNSHLVIVTDITLSVIIVYVSSLVNVARCLLRDVSLTDIVQMCVQCVF